MFAHEKATDQRAKRSELMHEKNAWGKLCGSVLVVDDSAEGRSVIGRVLRCAGLTVETAENGQVACERALATSEKGQPFDLIVMDMHMPVMDGYSATAYLREQGYTGRIAALTSNCSEGIREVCLSAGCDDFATKPIAFEALIDLAKQNLQAAKVPFSLGDARKITAASRVGPSLTRMCA